MANNDMKAVTGLVVALLVLWFALGRQLDAALAAAIVGLAVIYAKNLLALLAAVGLAAAVVFSPNLFLFVVFAAATVGMFYFAVVRHATLGSSTKNRDAGSYGYGFSTSWDEHPGRGHGGGY